MMPDKKEASDNSLNPAVDDVVFDIASDDGPEADQAKASRGDAQGAATAEEVGGSTPLEENATSAAQEEPPSGDDQPAGEEPQDELSQLRAQLAEAESRADDNWDRLLRLQADMENQRKRAQNDVAKARKFAVESIVSDLLSVKDSLEMGLAAAQVEDADPQAIVEGADLTLKMLAQAFEKNNILEINPVDEKFDPEFHQAMSMQEVEGKAANTVISVMQKGYTLNDRLVRPALVMVAK